MSQQKLEKICDRVKQGEKYDALARDIDGLLIRTQRSPENIDRLTAAISDSDTARIWQSLWDDSPQQRWDIASTGGAGNLIPIFGYLWLKVAAEQAKLGDRYAKVVPKIATEETDSGLMDILASGGFAFPFDATAIQRECLQYGGVICQPDSAIAPIERALMQRCRETNLTADFSVTYASILSRQIATRCTHAIVDVKLGRETKMLSPWMFSPQNELNEVKVDDFLTACQNIGDGNERSLVITDEKYLQAFVAVLQRLGVAAKADGDWVTQDCQANSTELYPLQEVRWLLVNGNLPQGRAIGRQLTLLHMDELIAGDRDLLLMCEGDNEYKRLYRQVLPQICGCQLENTDATWQDLQEQWQILKSRLPKLNDFSAKKYLEFSAKNHLDRQDSGLARSYSDPPELEKSHSLQPDLEAISFGFYPYHWQVSECPAKIKTASLPFLAELFTWLCGSDPFDSEVGIWLHKLPGEEVQPPSDERAAEQRYLEICQIWQQPFLSIFYRPSRCKRSQVAAKARQFISNIELEAIAGIN
ncbi:MAG: hypothetical protein F6J93_21135 [Oscillatoria sp. SIO1A7]|nr:hypothetical protein [Oscillatoria sp. SIO1A7]